MSPVSDSATSSKIIAYSNGSNNGTRSATTPTQAGPATVSPSAAATTTIPTSELTRSGRNMYNGVLSVTHKTKQHNLPHFPDLPALTGAAVTSARPISSKRQHSGSRIHQRQHSGSGTNGMLMSRASSLLTNGTSLASLSRYPTTTAAAFARQKTMNARPQPRSLKNHPHIQRALQLLQAIGYLNCMIAFMPVALALRFSSGSPYPVLQFVFACLAIMPLAGLMGDATEAIADEMGPAAGGIMNATFGNAAELIVALFGVYRELDILVKASLVGSIISNVLFVLGCALFAGGVKFKMQTFNRNGAQVGSTMLVVAAIGFLTPAIYHSIVETEIKNQRFFALPADGSAMFTAAQLVQQNQIYNVAIAASVITEQRLSLSISIVLIITYVLTLFFQLHTHSFFFDEIAEAEAKHLMTGWQKQDEESVAAAATAAALQNGKESSDVLIDMKGSDHSSDNSKSNNNTSVLQLTNYNTNSNDSNINHNHNSNNTTASLPSILRKQSSRVYPSNSSSSELLQMTSVVTGGNNTPTMMATPVAASSVLLLRPSIVTNNSNNNNEVNSSNTSAATSDGIRGRHCIEAAFGTDHEIGSNNNKNEQKHKSNSNSSSSAVKDGDDHDGNDHDTSESHEADEEEEEAPMSRRRALLMLTVSTVLVALLSDVLTSAVTVAGRDMGLTQLFLGTIIVAIVGNAAEHWSAVTCALSNKLDVSLSIAFGSALQVAMFIMPLVIMCSYARAVPMLLVLPQIEVFAVVGSVVLSWMVVQSGQSNWLEGVLLLMIYLILALAFYYAPEIPDAQ